MESAPPSELLNQLAVAGEASGITTMETVIPAQVAQVVVESPTMRETEMGIILREPVALEILQTLTLPRVPMEEAAPPLTSLVAEAVPPKPGSLRVAVGQVRAVMAKHLTG
jgi:hypothetical protein